MILFYVDEAGDPNAHSDPLLEGETPLFCLTAVGIHSSKWRELDRALLTLKRTFYAPELTAFAVKYPSKRPENCEIKGGDVCKPSNARNRRNRMFAYQVLKLTEDIDARMFSVVWVKSNSSPVDPISMYTHSLQILAERFHFHCLSQNDSGLIVADSRTRNLDFTVASGHLSFLFGNPIGRTYTTLVEAPMFVDSSLSGGMQLADIVGGCLYGYYYQKNCAAIPGLYDGQSPLTRRQLSFNPNGPWRTATPARDYTHCRVYWPGLDRLQFRRSDVRPPRSGAPVPGFYGYREIIVR